MPLGKLMTFNIFRILPATALVLSASAISVSAAQPGQGQQRVTVECARYISNAVIWDRPMPVFIDDLVAYGYTLDEAQSIASRVCLDEAGVRNPTAMGRIAVTVLQANPPAGRSR